MIGYINYKQLGTGATGGGFRGNRFIDGIDQSKDYFYYCFTPFVRKNNFPHRCFCTIYTYGHKDTV